MNDLAQIGNAIAWAHALEIDRRMIAHVETAEGRVPTNQEIAAYGQKLIDLRHLPFTDTWSWRGTEVFRVVWWPSPGVPFLIVEPVAS